MSLEQFLSIIVSRRKIFIISIVFFTVLAALITFFLPKEYTSQTVISIDTGKVDPITNLPLSGMLVQSYMATQVEIISSHNTAKKVVEMLGIADLPEAKQQFAEVAEAKGNINDWLADAIVKNMEVFPSRDSNVITVTYTSEDPQFAAITANAFIDSYKKSINDMRAEMAQQNNAFFQKQITSLEVKLISAQKKLAEYQQKQGILASDERIDIETQRLSELSSQLVTMESLAIDAESRLKKGNSIAPDVLNNPLTQQLKSQIAVLEAKFKQVAAKEGPNNPSYQQALVELNSAKSQLETIIAQYTINLENTAINTYERLNNLKKSLDEQKTKILALKAQRSRLDVLQRDVDNAQQVYQVALQKLSESSLQLSMNTTNVSILQKAEPPLIKSKPRTILNIALGGFSGVIFGLISVFFLEFKFRTIRTKEDLVQILDAPFLIEIDD